MHDGIEPELLALAGRAVDAALAAGADQAEAYVSAGRHLKVAFAKNDIDTVGSNRETTLGIRVIKDHRLGFATTNNPATLDHLAQSAVAIAKASPPDQHNGLPQPQPVPQQGPLCHPDLAALGPQQLATLGSELLAMVLGLRSARLPDGRITIDTMEIAVQDDARAVVSSTGVRQAHRSAAASGDIFGMGILDGVPGSFSYDGDAVRDPDQLQAALDRAFRRFADKSFGALGATAGVSFRGPIVIPADAVSDVLIGHLVGALSADSVRQGTSPFAGRIGQRIAAPGFTLVEGGAGLDGHPLTPFDREGMPRQRTTLVEDGVLQGFLYDSMEARRAGRLSTGHAGGGAASLPSIRPACLSLAAGDHSLTQLEDMDQGIIVTRFSGSTDASSGDFSGVVKGGFLVQGGERRPIMETTIAGNLWEAMKNISGRSAQTELFYTTQRAPALRVEDISVTAG